MFGSLTQVDRRANRILMASIVVHCILLIVILLPRRAAFISPSSVKAGLNGKSLSYIYFPARSEQADSKVSAARKITLPRRAAKATRTPKLAPQREVDNPEKDEVAASGPPAGSIYGSSGIGSPVGQEVRPALRVRGSEPRITAADFAGLEGSVVIEITIDEAGNIVAKNLLRSFSPTVDQKVMAALEDWHFLPATKDGIAIPSKEDVYYHFPVER